jgi:hypothetical protein
MSHGYSRVLVNANNRADIRHPGVALGRICIQNDIPVVELAKALGVSRMTVYNWFVGRASPTLRLKARVLDYIEQLKKRT